MHEAHTHAVVSADGGLYGALLLMHVLRLNQLDVSRLLHLHHCRPRPRLLRLFLVRFYTNKRDVTTETATTHCIFILRAIS